MTNTYKPVAKLQNTRPYFVSTICKHHVTPSIPHIGMKIIGAEYLSRVLIGRLMANRSSMHVSAVLV
jgi:hypothetical protein